MLTPEGQRRLIEAIFTEPEPPTWTLLISGLLTLGILLIVAYLVIWTVMG